MRLLSLASTAVTTALALTLGAATASATTITASSWGNFTPSGFASCCYNVGYDQGGTREFRSVFNFDLSALAGTTVYGATLSLYEPSAGYAASLSSIDFVVGGTPNAATFNSIAAGSIYGTATLTAADSNSNIIITLDAAAIAAIQSAEGGFFAIGGYTTGVTGNNQIFSSTGSVPLTSVHLTLDTVPEPASLALFGVSLAGLGWIRRRKANATV